MKLIDYVKNTYVGHIDHEKNVYIPGTHADANSVSIFYRPVKFRSNQSMEAYNNKKNRFARRASVLLYGSKHSITGLSWLVMASRLEKDAMDRKAEIDQNNEYKSTKSEIVNTQMTLLKIALKRRHISLFEYWIQMNKLTNKKDKTKKTAFKTSKNIKTQNQDILDILNFDLLSQMNLLEIALKRGHISSSEYWIQMNKFSNQMYKIKKSKSKTSKNVKTKNRRNLDISQFDLPPRTFIKINDYTSQWFQSCL